MHKKKILYHEKKKEYQKELKILHILSKKKYAQRKGELYHAGGAWNLIIDLNELET